MSMEFIIENIIVILTISALIIGFKFLGVIADFIYKILGIKEVDLEEQSRKRKERMESLKKHSKK